MASVRKQTAVRAVVLLVVAGGVGLVHGIITVWARTSLVTEVAVAGGAVYFEGTESWIEKKVREHFGAVALRQFGFVDLRGCHVSVKLIDGIVREGNTRSLWLDGSDVGDTEVKHLADLESLHDLRLNRTRIGDVSMEALAEHKGLEILEALDTDVTDRGVLSLCDSVSLRVLAIGERITDEGVANIAKAMALDQLSVVGLKVSDSATVVLAQARIRRIVLCGTSVSSVGVERLLTADHIEQVTVDKAIAQILREKADRDPSADRISECEPK